MTIQEASDKLTELCHQGHAQATLMFISGTDVKEVGNIEMLGDDTALVRSQIKWPEPYKPEYYEAEVINGRATGKAIKHQVEKEINKELVDENHKLADCNGRLLDQVGSATKRIIELEKENEELEKDKAYAEEQLDEQIQATLKLQKENAELKTKAKALLAKWVELFKPKGGNFPPTPIQIDTEQFIKEIEK